MSWRDSLDSDFVLDRGNATQAVQMQHKYVYTG